MVSCWSCDCGRSVGPLRSSDCWTHLCTTHSLHVWLCYVVCVCTRLWLDGVLQEAREVIEAAGVVLFKDASANKGELELVLRARVRLTWALEVLRVLVLC